ncbi:hypothetical protein EIKCOROL_00073 [Eikenella corrodens ATCC 23834]|uniref:Uncharacterized protein n=1 Tax=Eikenella corrodens ATCC 23834 TaxID=546274 RepID=C0DRV7_EIKCO|nr:hypothetical protein EIKCOROL_00073 [Eikenella corrodens ATCC 23834]
MAGVESRDYSGFYQERFATPKGYLKATHGLKASAKRRILAAFPTSE